MLSKRRLFEVGSETTGVEDFAVPVEGLAPDPHELEISAFFLWVLPLCVLMCFLFLFFGCPQLIAHCMNPSVSPGSPRPYTLFRRANVSTTISSVNFFVTRPFHGAAHQCYHLRLPRDRVALSFFQVSTIFRLSAYRGRWCLRSSALPSANRNRPCSCKSCASSLNSRSHSLVGDALSLASATSVFGRCRLQPLHWLEDVPGAKNFPTTPCVNAVFVLVHSQEPIFGCQIIHSFLGQQMPLSRSPCWLVVFDSTRHLHPSCVMKLCSQRIAFETFVN